MTRFIRRAILSVATLIAVPIAALAGFEKHFGDYAIVSAPEQESYPYCPLTEASITRKTINGYRVISLEASGHDSSCSIRVSAGLSVQEMPGVTCQESEDQTHCTNGSDVFEYSASVSADGVLTLHGVSTGSNPGSRTWILRRR